MRHNKITFIIFILISLIMWVIGGWNTDNGDFSNYEEMYTYDILAMTVSNTPDYGFYLIFEVFKIFGFSLIQARIVIYLVFLITLGIVILRLCRRPVLVLLLYFLVFYFRDVILLRNTTAMIFLLIGMKFYLSEKIKYKKIILSIFILIASTVHISFVFYFIILFADKKIRFSWIACGSIILAFIGKPIFGLLFKNLVSEENGQLQQKADTLMESGSYVSLVICSITVILSVLMCREAYRKMKSDNLSKSVFNINVIMTVILILTSISMSFIRMFYNLLIFDMVLMFNMASKQKSFSILQIIWILWIYLWSFWMSNVVSNFGRILANNSFL